MSSSTGAEIFAYIFKLIDKEIPKNRQKAVAKKVAREIRRYDVDPYQMGGDYNVNQLLLKWGLAEKIEYDDEEYYDMEYFF